MNKQVSHIVGNLLDDNIMSENIIIKNIQENIITFFYKSLGLRMIKIRMNKILECFYHGLV